MDVARQAPLSIPLTINGLPCVWLSVSGSCDHMDVARQAPLSTPLTINGLPCVWLSACLLVLSAMFQGSLTRAVAVPPHHPFMDE